MTSHVKSCATSAKTEFGKYMTATLMKDMLSSTVTFLLLKPVFHWAEFCARSGIFLCLVISRVELIRKQK